MCMRGAIPQVSALNPFGQYDGIYLVDSKRNVVYMSGTASNMFRMIDRPTNLNQQPLDTLESEDQQLVAQTFAISSTTMHCAYMSPACPPNFSG